MIYRIEIDLKKLRKEAKRNPLKGMTPTDPLEQCLGNIRATVKKMIDTDGTLRPFMLKWKGGSIVAKADVVPLSFDPENTSRK